MGESLLCRRIDRGNASFSPRVQCIFEAGALPGSEWDLMLLVHLPDDATDHEAVEGAIVRFFLSI